MELFDAIIIGGGPAGATSSYYLSKKGLKVALIDKKNIGKDKICGGGISNYAINELPFKLPDDVVEQKIRGVSFITPSGEILKKKESSFVGATVYRSIFDAYLIKKSLDANTTFYSDTKIKHIKKENDSFIVEGKYKAKYLIGADGANSIVKKTFGIGPKQNSKLISVRSFITLQNDELQKYISDPECIDFYFKNYLKGYGWVFPLRDAINIGVYSINSNPRTKHFLEELAFNSFHIPKKKIINSKIEGFPIPITDLPRRFSKDNVFLIGDAAGLVDPVSGEGIHYAIRSGKIVADTILKDYESILKGEIDHIYRSKIEKDIISDLIIAYKLKHFLELFFTGQVDVLFKIVKHNPFIFNYVQDIAIKSSYYNIFKDVLNNLPYIILDTIKGKKNIHRFSIEQKFLF